MKLQAIFILSIFCHSLAIAQQEDFTILKYNQTDLIVDLEIGLWPITIPVDYDGDGLTDILISCTSAPNKGLYFYKNIGTLKEPLFDKPVLIGAGTNKIFPSYVDGELFVLEPGKEYQNFIKDLYSNEKSIAIDKDPLLDIQKTRSNKWSYVDYDNDGDLDIIIGIDEWADYGWDNAYDSQGKWTNGPLHGYVYLLENDNGKFINRGKIEAGGKPIDTYGYPCPNMYDFDGDGDLDLICGEFVDKLTWYENIGTRENPVFKEGRFLENEDGIIKVYLEMFVPIGFDLDGDGHIDLLAGEEDGRIAFIRNTGKVKNNMPVFESPVYLKQKADNLKFGALVTPYSIDWDGDGDEDIIAGNSAGDIAFIENLTGGDDPVWAPPLFITANNEQIRIQAGESGSIQGPCEAKWGYTVLTVADWDNDGLPDIIINSILGEVMWYKNTGELTNLEGPYKMKVDWNGQPQKPTWNWWNPGNTDLVTQWRTSPVAIDWNKDGLMDLIMLDHEGYLCLFERFRKGDELWLKPGKRIFYINPDSPELLRLNEKKAGASGRRKFCFVDWDNDGDLDIIINSTNISFLENVKEENGKTYFIDRGNLSEKKLAGHTTCPTVIDWNNDGIKDILVGAEDGHFYLLQNPLGKIKAEKELNSISATILETHLIYQKEPYPSCHASTIIDTGEGLLAAWFGGTYEKHPDVSIYTAFYRNGQWEKPCMVADGIENDLIRNPCWNPVLYKRDNGDIILYYKIGPSPTKWYGAYKISSDNGKSWSKEFRIPDNLLGPIKNKPIRSPLGGILYPTSIEDDLGWRIYMEYSEQDLSGWKKIPINNGEYNTIQPSILTYKDGRMQLLCRSKNEKITESWSYDGGKSWSNVQATSLPNNNSGTDAVTLSDGEIQLLIYNPIIKGRNKLALAASLDGKTWKDLIILEDEKEGEFSYPAIIEGKNGKIYITYTYNRESIKYAIIDITKNKDGK